MKTREKTLFIFLLIFSISFSIAYSEQIIPSNNIYKNEHSDIKMWCVSTNSSHLSFYNGTTEFPRDQTKIINETTIELSLTNVSASETVVTCRWDHKRGVDMRKVIVGTVPKPIENYGCISYDFNYFVCQFKMPHNYVKVKYNVSYSIVNHSYDCPNQSDDGYILKCNITMESGKYRQVHDSYHFRIHAINRLGENDVFIETVSQFENVIPGKPSLNVTLRGPHSALMTWDVHKTLYRDTGLVFKIRVVDDYDPENWVDLNTSEVKSFSETKYSFELNNLYAFTWYEVQLYVKVRNASNTPEMWTQVNNTFRTDPKKPDDPPTLDIGSFRPQFTYNMSSTWFVVYWKGVPKQRANANKLHYVVTEARKNGEIVDIQPVEINAYSAKFVQYEKADYTFTIHTVNEKGMSEESATITVPKEDYPLPHLKKVYKDMNYILSWNEPETKNNLEIEDYTIFRCISASETSDQCKGDFDFVHVSRTNRSYTFTPRTTDNMNFAISANYKNGGSSGMIWAMCTASTNSDFGTVKPKGSLEPNGTTVKLEWSLDCVYSAIVEGFRLKYCPISINGSCKEPWTMLNISGSLSEYYLNNLKPYTIYVIQMSMYSTRKQGPESDNPLEITTLEAAPSEPRKLVLIRKTNNSIELQWEQPVLHNGLLRNYEVYYNSASDQVPASQNASKITYTINNLSSYTDYKIFVTAKTTNESKPSNDLYVRTSIGTPNPTNQIVKQGETLIWKRPTYPSGPIDFYEFRVSILYRGHITEESRITAIVGTQCPIQRKLEKFCRNNFKQVNFSVRAVNILPGESVDNVENEDVYSNPKIADEFKCDIEPEFHPSPNARYLRSEWSTPLTTNCEYADKSPIMIILYCVLSFAVMAVSVYHLTKKYFRMKDIGIAFPAGLTDLDQESGPKGCDNVISRDDMNRSEESLYKNENHKLLDSKRLSSGYVNGFDRTDKSDTVAFDDSSIEAIPADIDSNSSRHESVEMSDMSDSISNSPAPSPNMSLRDVVMQPPTMTQQMGQPRNLAKKPIIINGYVQHDSFNSFGTEPTIPYTSLESVANTIIPTNISLAVDSNEINKLKDIHSINAGPQENICGYVTHKQLSEFGHRQQ